MKFMRELEKQINPIKERLVRRILENLGHYGPQLYIIKGKRRSPLYSEFRFYEINK